MLLKFREHINIQEKYVNLINDNPNKEDWVDQVWDILQKSYSKIGGIKGSGFNSKDDMIKNIPFWKLNVVNGVVKTALMYKDKGGRKLVAIGTDGSEYASNVIQRDNKAELSRSFGEKSGPALGSMMKSWPFEVIEPFAILPKDVGKILNKDVIPLSKYKGDIDKADEFTIKKYPQLKKYFYFRKLAGSMKLKFLSGTPNMKILS